MKTILTTIAIGSVMIIGGCNKTKKVSVSTGANHTEPQEMDVEVEVENGEIIVMINGEEQVIDLSEIMENINLGNLSEADGEVSVSVMAFGDEDGPMHVFHGDGSEDGEHHYMMEWRTDQGGHPHGMEEMRERMMQMHGGNHGGPHGAMHGEWHKECPHGERDIPEEHQFMDELSTLEDLSHMMSSQSMAILGIHMIRDQLEGETRLEALERVIDETERGLPSRNAALIVAIETLQELGRQEEAAELMVELVVSN
ncbi:MAG: hypothetical protein H8E91_02290 [Planctomycetes bacterium]|nr:hypothetical protein [Planctomycetota bacterium]